MMRAVRQHAWGLPDVLSVEEVARPKPAPGEALVRVHGAGVNPVDWKTSQGLALAGAYGDEAFPYIPGWDVAGVVEALGAGADGVAVGDAVFGSIRFPEVGAAYAEYVTAPVEHLAPKPRKLDFHEAAALPLAALTAWQMLFGDDELRSGQRLLVTAAAGGVGHFAVQLGRWRGAHVIGTASAGNAEQVRAFGANEALDYAQDDWATASGPVDFLLDCVGGATLEQAWAAVRPGGRIVTLYGDGALEEGERDGVTAEWRLYTPSGEDLAAIGALIDEGVVRPHVEQVLPLDMAAEAHRRSQSGRVRGKIVLAVAAA